MADKPFFSHEGTEVTENGWNDEDKKPGLSLPNALQLVFSVNSVTPWHKSTRCTQYDVSTSRTAPPGQDGRVYFE
ncbi:hypothetical protein GMST_05880 [Geomonas silvestris]|uniref:Uncharacterized protein n=1 Tax=Geomonas silvestris TaxID=2740184 RepID=A0A6V8MEL0_9BACT|nr:hypothetical protein GMST_05880 [Geomonas silvestris]